MLNQLINKINTKIDTTADWIYHLVDQGEIDHSRDWLIHEIPDNADVNVINWYQELNDFESAIDTVRDEPELSTFVCERTREINHIINMITDYLNLIS
jgi:hypothetical protein